MTISFESLSAEQLARLCEVVDRFDAAWQEVANGATAPRIERVLRDIPEAEQPAFLRELLAVDVECRQKFGGQPTAEEYRTLFPKHAALVETVVREQANGTMRKPLATHVESAVGPGSVIGDYEIIQEIARGGMGVVFKARHVKLKRTVALKMILMGGLATPDLVERFLAEARAAGKLEHPGIVPVYEIGQHDGRHFFAMQFVDGESLATRLQRGLLKPRTAAKLVRQLARAVQFAHEHGIVHRDLKPGNILITAKGSAKVADFGLAKQLDSSVQMSMTGDIIGTPSYMAPEQAAGQVKAIGPATDVYALGAILYAVLTGNPPFQAGTPLATLKQVLEQEPVSPRVVVKNLSLDLETICLKCLRKVPAQRYPSADALAAELQRFLADEPIQARPISRKERFVRWCWRKRWLVAALLLMATSFVVMASFWKTREQSLLAEANRHAKLAKEADARAAREVENVRQAKANLDAERMRADAASAQARATEEKLAAAKASKENGENLRPSPEPAERQVIESKTPSEPQGTTKAVFDSAKLHPLVTGLPTATALMMPGDSHDHKVHVQYVSFTDGQKVVSSPNLRALPLVRKGTTLQTTISNERDESNQIPVSQTPNLIVDLYVEESQASAKYRQERRANFLPNAFAVSVAPEVTAIDDKGRRISSLGTSKFGWRFSAVDSQLPDGRDTFFFCLPDPERTVRFKSVEGTVLEEFGVEVSATFSHADLTRGKNFKVGAVPIRLEAMKTTEFGFEIELSVKNLPTPNISVPTTTESNLKKVWDEIFRVQPRVSAVLKDSRGTLVFPSAEHHRRGGDSSTGDFVFRYLEYVPKGAKKLTGADVPVPQPTSKHSHELSVSLHFSRLPNGENPESLNVLIFQPNGNSLRRIPFCLTDVPLPQAAQQSPPPVSNPQQAQGNDSKMPVSTAVKNLRVKLANDPDNPQLLADMGFTYGSMGRFTQAKEPLQRAIQLRPDQFHWPFGLGMVLVELNELESYRTLCQETLARHRTTTHAQTAEIVSKLCTFGEDAVADYTPVFELVNRVKTLTTDEVLLRWTKLTTAEVLLRMRRDQEAVQAAQEAMTGPAMAPHFEIQARCVQALAQARLQERAKAVAEFQMADRLLQQHAPRPDTEVGSWVDWLFCRHLHRQAADVLGLKTPATAVVPFNAKQASKYQEDWAKHLGLPVTWTNSIGMKFQLIPPGEFTMGSTDVEVEKVLADTSLDDARWATQVRSEAPQHKVVLSQALYLGVQEVRQKDFQAVMGRNPSWFSPTGEWKKKAEGFDTASHPVEAVTWNDAAEFCTKLSQIEKLQPRYLLANDKVTLMDGEGYRLPTEAEWEFACRAGTTTKYWAGADDKSLLPTGWHLLNASGRSHAVGELPANPFGLHDMHGNVWEWVQDSGDAKYYAQLASQPAIDPQGPATVGPERLLRGGSWNLPARYCRSAFRGFYSPTARIFDFGFRVALPTSAVRPQVDPK